MKKNRKSKNCQNHYSAMSLFSLNRGKYRLKVNISVCVRNRCVLHFALFRLDTEMLGQLPVKYSTVYFKFVLQYFCTFTQWSLQLYSFHFIEAFTKSNGIELTKRRTFSHESFCTRRSRIFCNFEWKNYLL